MGQEQITLGTKFARRGHLGDVGGWPALCARDGRRESGHAFGALPSSVDRGPAKTAAGMITVRRRGDDVALMVFGNASVELLAARAEIATTFATASLRVGT